MGECQVLWELGGPTSEFVQGVETGFRAETHLNESPATVRSSWTARGSGREQSRAQKAAARPISSRTMGA